MIKKDTKKIILGGITGLRNRGVDAMVRGFVDGAGNQCEAVVFSVHTHSPAYDSRVFPRSNVTYLEERWVRIYRTRLRAEILRPFFLEKYVTRRQSGDFSDADAYVFCGGDLTSAEYEASLFGYLHGLVYAQRCGVPTAFYAQSVGQHEGRAARRFLKDTLEQCCHVSVREPSSAKYLESLGVPNVSFSADPAFSLDNGLINPHDAKPAGRVGVAISDSMSIFTDNDRDLHKESLKRLIENIISNGKEVVLIPHVQETWAYSDDRTLAFELEREFEGSVTAIYRPYDSTQFRDCIKDLSLLYAERMHAGIAAASQLVPTIFISYSPKAKGMAELLYGAANSGNYVVTMSDLARLTSLDVADHLSQTDRMAELLAQSIPRVRESALKGIAQLLRDLRIV